MRSEHVRRKASLALLLIDVVNHFEFPDGRTLLRNALQISPHIKRLKERARRAKIPVTYVNDNFGQWLSDSTKLLRYCLREECAGKPFVQMICPDAKDYCVLKPMHSAFYQTPLELLLRDIGARSLVIAGLATNSCVLCTTHDANMRNFRVTVVSDCCAARSRKEHDEALRNIESMANARVIESAAVRFSTSLDR
jgi:nicotinamidase-related amidase